LSWKYRIHFHERFIGRYCNPAFDMRHALTIARRLHALFAFRGANLFKFRACPIR